MSRNIGGSPRLDMAGNPLDLCESGLSDVSDDEVMNGPAMKQNRTWERAYVKQARHDAGQRERNHLAKGRQMQHGQRGIMPPGGSHLANQPQQNGATGQGGNHLQQPGTRKSVIISGRSIIISGAIHLHLQTLTPPI